MVVVEEAILSGDNRVRKVMIAYRTKDGTRLVVERPVQKLIVLVPNDN